MVFASGKEQPWTGTAASVGRFTEGTSPVLADPEREGSSHSVVELDVISRFYWATDCWRAQLSSHAESLIYA